MWISTTRSEGMYIAVNFEGKFLRTIYDSSLNTWPRKDPKGNIRGRNNFFEEKHHVSEWRQGNPIRIVVYSLFPSSTSLLLLTTKVQNKISLCRNILRQDNPIRIIIHSLFASYDESTKNASVVWFRSILIPC